jgi:hypothetical protein
MTEELSPIFVILSINIISIWSVDTKLAAYRYHNRILFYLREHERRDYMGRCSAMRYLHLC